MSRGLARHRRLISALCRSRDPSIRWRTRVRVLGESRSSSSIRALEREIRSSKTVQALLSRRDAPYRPGWFGGVYRYWQGIHWALASLADIGYPEDDPDLRPLLDRALSMWSLPRYDRTARVTPTTIRTVRDAVPLLRGRYRRCASQQGNALYYASSLARPDGRARHLAGLLERWQWEDGGWNCDRSVDADSSSFMETLTPMRGLAAFAGRTNSARAGQAARRAGEVFLSRRLFRRRSDGKVMRPDFLRLHYPVYWHYDVLAGLKGMVEIGRISDPRCLDALDWLEGRELRNGGWPVDARYYRYARTYQSGADFVNWGDPGLPRRNDWVTTDALYVLRAAGRLDL